jgi:hypothetical protein
MNSAASERLALLSNTAMLKNVLDKRDLRIRTSNEISTKAPLSHYEDLDPGLAPMQAPPLSPRPGISSQGRESLSPHVVTEARRDSPPASCHRPDHSQQYHHFVSSSNFRGQSDYPPFPPLPNCRYTQAQPPAERYPRDNRSAALLAPLAPQLDHQRRMQMENMIGQTFRSPYDERHAGPVLSTAGSRPPDTSGRPINYYSPPLISVSDDCEDTNATSQHPPAFRPAYETLLRDNVMMREQLHEKDTIVSSLQHRVSQLETQINELRQLPTGKISHIPIEYVNCTRCAASAHLHRTPISYPCCLRLQRHDPYHARIWIRNLKSDTPQETRQYQEGLHRSSVPSLESRVLSLVHPRQRSVGAKAWQGRRTSAPRRKATGNQTAIFYHQESRFLVCFLHNVT